MRLMIEGRTTFFTPRPCLQGRGRGGVNKAPYVRAVVNKAVVNKAPYGRGGVNKALYVRAVVNKAWSTSAIW